MSSISDLLSLPYIQGGQAQKHVTHNEALRILDTLVLLHVIRTDMADPPAQSPTGDRYIVAAQATGAWAGKDHFIAVSDHGSWRTYAPQAGWVVWDHLTQSQRVYNGTEWVAVAQDVDQLDQLGL